MSKLSLGERAMVEVCQLLHDSQQRRERLRRAGWKRDTERPMVNGHEWLWYHPQLGYFTESEAIKWLHLPRWVDQEVED